MPELIPTVIKVTQGGVPLEGASISLVPKPLTITAGLVEVLQLT